MPRKALVLLVVSILLAPVGVAVAGARERWRRPLTGGAVAGSFSFERAAPYVRGRRRGIDLRGRPGTRVVASCAGVVTHAGRVPAWGRGVTLRCGRLAATELGLSSLAVARGARVLPGTEIGRLAERGVLRLGARVAADRQGYVDPAALLDDARPAPPVLPTGPRGVGRRRVAPPPAAVAPRVAAPSAVASPAVARPAAVSRPAAPAVAPAPWPVLPGLALLAAGAGGGVTTRRRRRRWAGAGIALAQR